MSERQETIADVITEMRGLVKPGETLENTYELLNGLADRIEAAYRAETLRWVEANAGLAKLIDPEKMLTGNHAKMHEALVLALSLLDLKEGVPYKTVSQKDLDFMKDALAAPARACDALSANELKLQVFAGLAYQIKIKGLDIRGLEVLLRSVAGAVIDIAYDTNEEGNTND